MIHTGISKEREKVQENSVKICHNSTSCSQSISQAGMSDIHRLNCILHINNVEDQLDATITTY